MSRNKPLRLVVVAAAAVLSLAGCAGVQIAKASIEHPGQLLFNGHVKEDVNCFKCHGGDARGSMRGPSLEVTAKMSDAEILEYIDEGEGIMPSFADELTSDEKAQIISWLRQEFGAPAAQ